MNLFTMKNLLIAGAVVLFSIIAGFASYYWLGLDKPIETEIKS